MDKAAFKGSIETKEIKVLDLESLKNIIKNMAKCHSQEISNEKGTVLKDKREFNVVKLAQEVISQLHNIFNLETDVSSEAKILEDSAKTIMGSSILVKDQGKKQLVPLSYEVLRLIFSATNEKFRQNCSLTDYFYQELTANLKKFSVNKGFNKEDFDQEVKVFLPIVKLETALQLAQNKDPESQELLQEIVSNLALFFKYPRLNQEDIYKIVNNKLNSSEYKLLSYELIPLEERNGYLGDYYKLKIIVDFKNKKLLFNLFAKFLTPKLEAMKKLVKSGPSQKEEFFYQKYLPVLEENGLGSLLDFAPKCYFSRLCDVLVLDDMVACGFTALTPNIKLEFDALMCLVKKMAKFHAGGMMLEEILNQQAKKVFSLYDRYPEYLQEVMLTDAFDVALSAVHYLIKKFPEYSEITAADGFREKVDALWEHLHERVKKSDLYKNTICHGDVYVGNMLFKFDDQNRCQDAILVDFQILRYCPPVHDLLFFIYQNSLKETRDKHYRQLVDGYYQELSKHFERFNMNIAEIYPKENFEESLTYMKSEAVLRSIMYSQFNSLEPSLRTRILQDEELANKYFFEDTTALIDLGFEDDNYKKALGGLVADLIEIVKNE